MVKKQIPLKDKIRISFPLFDFFRRALFIKEVSFYISEEEVKEIFKIENYKMKMDYEATYENKWNKIRWIKKIADKYDKDLHYVKKWRIVYSSYEVIYEN